jgi:hypothetical protein
LTPTLEVEKEKEALKGYCRLKGIWSGMLVRERDSEREWLVETKKLFILHVIYIQTVFLILN